MADNNNSMSARVNNGGLRLRKHVRSLTDREVNDLRHAYEGLYRVSEDGGNNDERGYQWIAGVHGLPTPFYCQHGNENFPTWHRAYIYEFELRLQEQVPGVMLPYWDWTSDESLANGIPDVVAAETYVDMDSGETKPNPLYSAFSQATGRDTRRSPGPLSQLAQLRTQVEMALRQTDYERFWPALENPHGGLHVWVGGDMGSVPTSSFDPIFWMHHCNVDKQWFDWQRQHGNDTVPQSARDWVCTPFNYTGEDTLDTAYFGYTYAEDEAFTAASSMQPEMVGDTDNQLSLEAPMPQPGFKHAFLEMHGISKTVGTYQVNVYFGDPGEVSDCEARSPESGYANTLYLFGHGECAGGVGHCDLKPRPRYDKRPPHHLVPFNTYLDVTEALRRYDDAGKGAGRITLRAFDADGRPVSAREIRMQGLSLVTHM